MQNTIIKRLLDALNSIRDNGPYWYPLANVKDSVPVIAYDIDKIYADNQIDLLEETLKSCSIQMVTTVQLEQERVFESEDILKLLYEKDESGYNFPWYVETYYFDDTKDWLLYVSHEGTITFTGKEVVAQAEKIIPSKYLYC